MLRTTFTYFAIMVLLPQCMSQDEKYSAYDHSRVPFNFTEPSVQHKLPDDLYEISGIAWFHENLACVEDEHGRLYLYDIVSDEILDEINFARNGDFEGVEIIDNHIYAIESNGDLHRFTMDSEAAEKLDTPFSGKNDVEGLGVIGTDLLVACKASGAVEGIPAKNKAIYRLDPDKPDEAELLIEISIDELRQFIDSKQRPGKVHEFDPSGVAYDDRTKQLYVLSADQILVITNLDGSLVEVIFLDPKSFRQPEGICFDDKGSLYLSSEGAGAPAKVYRFDRN